MEHVPYSDIKPNIINLMSTSEGSYAVSSAGVILWIFKVPPFGANCNVSLLDSTYLYH